ncbi:DUF4445 domain-containing protein [Candidatus Magnetomoraceae bacterium gMMP-1]
MTFQNDNPEPGTQNSIKILSIDKPDLSDNTADADRIIKHLKSIIDIQDIEIDLALLKKLPDILRKSDFHIKCTMFQYENKCVLIDVKNVDDTQQICGLAIDLGTTRVVMRLIDLSTNNTLGEITFDNPQIEIGPDILARIHYTDQADGLSQLNQLIIDGINRNIKKLCGSHAVSPNNILCLALAGNTAMTHLFLGLDPHWIIREPYIPVINKPGLMRASELGLKTHPLSRIFVFPNAGSYFGGDLIAGILFSGIHSSEDIVMMVDVGTNAEVVLGNKDWLLVCAGAAGPALEGGMSKIGMTAGPGAVERVAFDQDSNNFQITTIDNARPAGICGSGVIDLAACLFKSGMLDIRGKFIPDKCGSRLGQKNGIKHFTLINEKDSATGFPLTISQADVDSLIRSKAAMYTILTTITSSIDMQLLDLPVFYVAGTFGSYINPESAITIGMIPDLPLNRYKSLGNSSLEGASLALTSMKDAAEINRIQKHITYMELNVNQEFMNRFSAAKFLPHTDRSLFPSVNIL